VGGGSLHGVTFEIGNANGIETETEIETGNAIGIGTAVLEMVQPSTVIRTATGAVGIGTSTLETLE
jgi:hypothetical protein